MRDPLIENSHKRFRIAPGGASLIAAFRETFRIVTELRNEALTEHPDWLIPAEEGLLAHLSSRYFFWPKLLIRLWLRDIQARFFPASYARYGLELGEKARKLHNTH